MGAEQKMPGDGTASPKDGAPKKEGLSLTDRIRPSLVDALQSTSRPFTDGFYVEPQPVVNGMAVKVSSYLVNLDRSYPQGTGPNREVHRYALNSGVGSISATFSTSGGQEGQSLYDYSFITPKEVKGRLHAHLLTALGEEVNMNEPVVIVTTYSHEGGIVRVVNHEILDQKTEENARHFGNLEGLMEALKARKKDDK
jgi:hypothetical protein